MLFNIKGRVKPLFFISGVAMAQGLYYSLNDYFRKKYNCRVQRVAVSLPFTCPHTQADGSGGCTYCLQGSKPKGADAKVPLAEQIKKGISAAGKRYGKSVKYIIYYQSYTNTNAPLEELKRVYDAAFNHEDVIGISVGTRPDCCGDGVLKLLESYCGRGTEIWIELGLQSANDRTLERINRRHTAADFIDTVQRVKKAGLMTAAHIMIGLPGETEEDFIRTAELIASLKVNAIKIHPLHIMDGTALGDEFKRSPFKVLKLEEYVKVLADIAEILPPDMIMMRFTSEANEGVLLAPDYCRPEFKNTIKDMFIAELNKRGTKQGSKYRL
jgi:radical SAM protein (TIGR01212 family)